MQNILHDNKDRAPAKLKSLWRKGGVTERKNPTNFVSGVRSVVHSDVVPVVGVEPTRYRYHRILSPARLPIPSHRHKQCLYILSQYFSFVKHEIHIKM